MKRVISTYIVDFCWDPEEAAKEYFGETEFTGYDGCKYWSNDVTIYITPVGSDAFRIEVVKDV